MSHQTKDRRMKEGYRITRWNTNDDCPVNLNNMRNQTIASTVDVRLHKTFFVLIFIPEEQMYELFVPQTFSLCLKYILRTTYGLFSSPSTFLWKIQREDEALQEFIVLGYRCVPTTNSTAYNLGGTPIFERNIKYHSAI